MESVFIKRYSPIGSRSDQYKQSIISDCAFSTGNILVLYCVSIYRGAVLLFVFKGKWMFLRGINCVCRDF